MRHLPILAFTLTTVLLSTPGFTCTRALSAKEGQAVMVGRNMDWYEDTQTTLWVYPRGIEHDGLSMVNSLNWTSKYGSIVAAAYTENVPTDGMNEKGLAAHMLWLSAADYGKRDEKLPGFSVGLWVQYYLDNFQTVDEAVRFTEMNTFQLEPFYYPKIQSELKLHLALEDARGDSAIIEYTNGTLHVYHNKDYKVVTNDPVYHLQLENLKQYSNFGGDKPLPGTNSPKDRFVRATYYTNNLPKAHSNNEEVAHILSVMQNAGQPYRAGSSEHSKIGQSIWRTVSDLTHRVYYFNSLTSYNIIYASLDKFDLRVGAPTMVLDLPYRRDLPGDVSKEFEPIENSVHKQASLH